LILDGSKASIAKKGEIYAKIFFDSFVFISSSVEPQYIAKPHIGENKMTTKQFRYRNLQDLFKNIFNFKVQKISINAGFTCPNRDGNKGYGGCTYCNNQTFSPDYCHTEESISSQIEKGIKFFSHKYPDMKYLAYFQAYTNTYEELSVLKAKYEEALSYPNVVGLIIGTRPDCMPDTLLDYLEDLSKSHFVMVEYGVESTLDTTLKYINRGHTFECSADAIRRTAQRGILTGAHMILGLPGEDRDIIIGHAKNLSQLPITTLKLHQLQLIKQTKMARQFAEEPERFHIYNAQEYIDLAIDFIENLRPDIVVERFVSQSPKELLIAPDWGLKNYEFTALLEKRLEERATFQGRLYCPQQ
jgi:radical SAM protein, TIGR01212 family